MPLLRYLLQKLREEALSQAGAAGRRSLSRKKMNSRTLLVNPLPTRLRRSLEPMIGTLEPRYVLNASAELNALGQLVISGDASADTVQLDMVSNTELVIRDGSGAVVPITGHPGNDTDPLDTSLITSGDVFVDLGAGDDRLRLELPTGLDIQVIAGLGNDSTSVDAPVGGPVASGQFLTVDSERIQINSASGAVDLSNRVTNLVGMVTVGNPNATTSVLLDNASLSVSGLFRLDGDVNLTGDSTRVDLSSAVLSALTTDTDLKVTVGPGLGSDVLLGVADDTSGSLVHDVTIRSANTVNVAASTFSIDGALAIEEVTDRVDINADVIAGGISIIAGGDVSLDGSLIAIDDGIALISDQEILLEGNVASLAGRAAFITVDADTLNLRNVQIATAGGTITMDATTTIDGRVHIDSGNQSQAAIGGNIRFTGSINSLSTDFASLEIDSRGVSRGAITIEDQIGNLNQLDSVVIHGGALQVSSIQVRSQDLLLDALGTMVTGPQLIAAGNVEIIGSIALPVGNFVVQGNNVILRGALSGQPGSQTVRILAEGNATFGGAAVGFETLIAEAGGTVSLTGPVNLAGDLDVTGGTPTQVSAPSIQTLGSQSFVGGLLILASGRLTASEAFLGGVVEVRPQMIYTVDAPVIGVDVRKTGDGELVFKGTNEYIGQTFIDAGVLRIDGQLFDGAGPVRVNRGRLEGSGLIFSEVIAGGQGVVAPGSDVGRLTVGGLALNSDAVVEFQFRSVTAGSSFDQLLVDSQATTIRLASARLALSFEGQARPATEYVIVRNDSSLPINGVFTAGYGPSGETLATPRLLTEGSLVLQDFGGSGRPAYITYAGGDGNDVAIVTAGDLTIEAGVETLVQRNGSNLEIRTGTDPAATPTIRPIAALNDYTLRVVGSGATETLFVDLNQLFDSSLNAVQYTGTIDFVGGGSGDSDRIIFTDRDITSNDGLMSIRYGMNAAQNGTAELVTNGGSKFDVRYTQLEKIVQSVSSAKVEVQYSNLDEKIHLANVTGSTTDSRLTSGPSGVDFEVSFEIEFRSPSDQFSVLGGSGNDTITIGSSGSTANVHSEWMIDGQAGTDSVSVLSALSLGRGDVVGNLHVAAESLTVSGNVDSTGGAIDGRIELIGGGSIQVNRSAVIDSGSAPIFIDALQGTFDSSAGFLQSDRATDAITIQNATAVTFGNVTVLAGQLKVETDSLGGGVSQAVGTRLLVDRLDIDADGGVKLSSVDNHIKQIETILSRGEVSVRDSEGDLRIDRIDSRGFNINVSSSGNVALSSGAILATGAIATVDAGRGITDRRVATDNQDANVSASVINLSAGIGGIGQLSRPVIIAATDSVNANTSSVGSDILLRSPELAMPIGRIDAGTGAVTLSSVSIDDATVDAIIDISARKLMMTAVSGIGSGRVLELDNVTDLTATTNTGGIQLDHASKDKLIVRSLTADTSGAIDLRHRGTGLLEIAKIETRNGSVTVVHETGSIVVGDGSTNEAIKLNTGGDLTLMASGSQSNIKFLSHVLTTFGNVQVNAGHDVLFETTGEIKATSGSISIIADALEGNAGGRIEMKDGAVIEAPVGPITMTADGNIILGSVISQSRSLSAIVIQSTSGAVTDGGDAKVDVVANAGGAMITAALGIGALNPIETSLAFLDARVSGEGALSIIESDAIVLRSVETADGSIEVVAGGTVTATSVVSLNPNGIDEAASDRDISITATDSKTDSKSDVLVESIVAMNGADVMLVADDDVLDDKKDTSRIESDDLNIASKNRTLDGFAIDVTTAVNDLVLAVSGSNRGDVEIRELDSIRLASSDSGSDLVDQLVTGNGSITVVAGDSIKIDDKSPNNDGVDFKDDREIVAGGDFGTIHLKAGKTIELAGATQLAAQQSSKGAITIESNQVAFGQQVELHTGNGVGIARWFSPRPMPDLAGTAFFDFTTVATNRLTQVGANDAQGILSMVIGRPGEKGLTINYDWGAPSNRFQQVNDRIGGQVYAQAHTYLESDILDSLLNERESATAPLEVRFSVRHHESILVLASSVTQQPGLREEVASGLISSTGKIELPELSSPLENGTASFFIPNLTIPVAFFPVRQIIPEVVRPEIFVRTESTSYFSSGTVETKSVSVSASVTREEYFQIRVLSPEPGGEDLAPPERLPDDILAGDKLQRLFAELPDGKYEIQYVLGDGNERVLLRVDIRNGEAIVPGDELDGSPLLLEELDIEKLQQEINHEIEEKLHSENRDDEVSPQVSVSQGMMVGALSMRLRAIRNRRVAKANRFSLASRFSNRGKVPR